MSGFWAFALGAAIVGLWRGLVHPYRLRKRIDKTVRYLHPAHASTQTHDPPPDERTQALVPVPTDDLPQAPSWQPQPIPYAGWERAITLTPNRHMTVTTEGLQLSLVYPFRKRFEAHLPGAIPPTLWLERTYKEQLRLKTFDRSFGVKTTEYVGKEQPDDRAKFIYMTGPVRAFFMAYPKLQIHGGALHIPWQGRANTQSEIAAALASALALSQQFFALWGNASEVERLEERLTDATQPLLRLRALQYLLIEEKEVALASCYTGLEDTDTAIRLTAALHLAGPLHQPDRAFAALLALAVPLALDWEQQHLCLEGLFLHYPLASILPTLIEVLQAATRPADEDLRTYVIRRASMRKEPTREQLAQAMLDMPHCTTNAELYKQLAHWAKEPKTLALLEALLIYALPSPTRRVIKRVLGRIELRLREQQGGELTLGDELQHEGSMSFAEEAEGMLSLTNQPPKD